MSYMYQPQADERETYDLLWSVASPTGADLSGLQAVNFFKQSGVDINTLKTVWAYSTPLATMNKAQFYCALRYIQMVQNNDLPLSKEKLTTSALKPMQAPKFGNLNLNPKKAANSPDSSANSPNSLSTHFPPITPEAHIRYHDLFCQYDTDKDGFISGPEAVAIFSKSGLDVDTLKKIWLLSDRDQDNRLTSKEFCVAFHLIVCVGKHSFGVPTQLPTSFQAFLVNAPKAPKVGAPPQYSPSAPAAAASGTGTGSDPRNTNVSARTPDSHSQNQNQGSALSTPTGTDNGMSGMGLTTPGSANSFQSSASHSGTSSMNSTPGSAISALPSPVKTPPPLANVVGNSSGSDSSGSGNGNNGLDSNTSATPNGALTSGLNGHSTPNGSTSSLPDLPLRSQTQSTPMSMSGTSSGMNGTNGSAVNTPSASASASASGSVVAAPVSAVATKANGNGNGIGNGNVNVEDHMALKQAKQISEDVGDMFTGTGTGGAGASKRLKNLAAGVGIEGQSEKLRALLTEISDKLKKEKSGLADAGKFKGVSYKRGYYSILVVSCFLWGGALDT